MVLGSFDNGGRYYHKLWDLNPKLLHLLQSLNAGEDGIYGEPAPFSHHQSAEIALRERVASARYDNYLDPISCNHSIAVMDQEVDRFLAKIPKGGLILDIGGCWGWHWRRLARTRPDVGMLIVDFVRSNLSHARNVLGSLVGDQVALMHADATALPFSAGGDLMGFDGVWTVQTFQHIPDYALACREAHRVLKPGGRFITYSLQAPTILRALYALLGKTLHLEGQVANSFHLNRASESQKQIVAKVFGNKVSDRYTECLFHPDLRLTFSGKEKSFVGRLDAGLSGMPQVGRWIARQRSFETIKQR